MALINCPECKREISDQALSCPNCGFPLQKEQIVTPVNQPGLKRSTSSNIVIGVFLILIIAGILIILMGRPNNNSSQQLAETASDTIQRLQKAIDSINNNGIDGIYYDKNEKDGFETTVVISKGSYKTKIWDNSTNELYKSGGGVIKGRYLVTPMGEVDGSVSGRVLTLKFGEGVITCLKQK